MGFKQRCIKKDCRTFDIEKDECSSTSTWNGCQDWTGFDYWNYQKRKDMDDRIEELKGQVIQKENELIAWEWSLKSLQERIKELDENIERMDNECSRNL